MIMYFFEAVVRVRDYSLLLKGGFSAQAVCVRGHLATLLYSLVVR